MNNNSFVIELTDSDFIGQTLINYQDKIVLIKFYTTWCGYCTKSIPAYEKLAFILKDDPNFVIAQIDCDKYKDTIDTMNKFNYGFQIKGYPTIIIYKYGKMYKKYEDERDVLHYLKALYNSNK